MAPAPIVLTQGDPEGIGPEIILKALSANSLPRSFHFVIMGDPKYFRSLKKSAPVSLASPDQLGPESSFTSLRLATELCLKKKFSALVTAPVNKAKISLAHGIKFIGHTEFLKKTCERYYHRAFLPTMLFWAPHKTLPGRFLSLATTHIPICDISKSLTAAKLKSTVLNTHVTLKDDFRIERPSIALLGLNPHAGEGGLFGAEEKNLLLPLIDWAKRKKIFLSGPFPPDSFFAVHWNHFSAVMSLYHDQGLIPFKLLHFDSSVNITSGLPIIRTSVDHGVGYDIAGKGVASPQSMVKAIHIAVHIVKTRETTKRNNQEK